MNQIIQIIFATLKDKCKMEKTGSKERWRCGRGQSEKAQGIGVFFNDFGFGNATRKFKIKRLSGADSCREELKYAGSKSATKRKHIEACC